MNPVNSFVMTSLPKPLLLLCTLPLVNFSFPFFHFFLTCIIGGNWEKPHLGMSTSSHLEINH